MMLKKYNEDRKPRLIILCGLPGSGKTTFARRLENELSIVRLCLEELWQRLMARNQHGEHGIVPISHTDLERMSAIFQAPDAAEFALFAKAAEVADARLHSF